MIIYCFCLSYCKRNILYFEVESNIYLTFRYEHVVTGESDAFIVCVYRAAAAAGWQTTWTSRQCWRLRTERWESVCPLSQSLSATLLLLTQLLSLSLNWTQRHIYSTNILGTVPPGNCDVAIAAISENSNKPHEFCARSHRQRSVNSARPRILGIGSVFANCCDRDIRFFRRDRKGECNEIYTS